jgi:hypothetical protein
VDHDGDTVMDGNVQSVSAGNHFYSMAEEPSGDGAHDSLSGEEEVDDEEVEEDEEDDKLPWPASSPAAQKHLSPAKSPLPPSSPPPESSPDSPVNAHTRIFAPPDLPPDSSGLQEPLRSPSKHSSTTKKRQPATSSGQAGSEGVGIPSQPNVKSTVAAARVVASSPNSVGDLQGTSTTSTLFSTAVQPLKTPKPKSLDWTRPTTASSLVLDSSAVDASLAVKVEETACANQSSPQRVQESPRMERSFTRPIASSKIAHTMPTSPIGVSQGLSSTENLAVRSSPAKMVPSTFQPYLFANTSLSDMAMDGTADYNVPSRAIATDVEQQIQHEMEAFLIANSQMEIDDNTANDSRAPRPMEIGSIQGSPRIQAPSSNRRSEADSSPPPSAASPNRGRGAPFALSDAHIIRTSRSQGSSTFHLSQDTPVSEDPAKVAAKRRREFLKELAGDETPSSIKKLKHTNFGRAAGRGVPPVEDHPKPVQNDSVLPQDELQDNPSGLRESSHSDFTVPNRNTESPPLPGPLSSLSTAKKTHPSSSGVCTRCQLPGHKQWEQDKCGLISPDYDTIVYMEFRRTYPQYNGDRTHFTNMCSDIFKQEQSQRPLTAAFWDDYVIRHLGEYNPYAISLLNQGLPSRPYADYYSRMVDDPMHLKMVLTRDKLYSMSFAAGSRYVPS